MENRAPLQLFRQFARQLHPEKPVSCGGEFETCPKGEAKHMLAGPRWPGVQRKPAEVGRQ
jgi:hypothetical protein